MAYIDIPIDVNGDDAASYHNHSGYTSNAGGWIPIQQHVNTSLATVAGWRFKIPSTIDPADITDVHLRVTSNGTGTTAFASPLDVRVEKTTAPPIFANNDTQRPSNRHAAAVTASATSYGWSPAAVTSGQLVPSFPNIATDVVARMTDGAYVPDTTYVGILVKAPIAGPLTIQANSREAASSGLRPVLRVTYDAPPTWDAISQTNVSYTDGVGNATFRVLDIDVPAGEPPDPAGRPVVVYLHGGGWRSGVGGPSMINATWKSMLLGMGVIVVNASYSLVQSDILISNVGRSFPEPLQDMRTLANWLTTNAEEYRIDTTKMVLAGESAGGHVAIFTVASQGDTSNYTGYQNVNNNRSNVPGNTRPAFDLDKNISSTPFAAAWAWVAPIDVWEITQHPNSTQAAANAITRTGYMGADQFNPPGSSFKELDLHHYIAGTGTTYGSTTHEPQVPIGYMRATSDSIVTPAAGVDALYTALGTSGFTYDRPSVGTISETGLSRFEVATAHDAAPTDATGRAQFADWLEVVLGLEDPPPAVSAWQPQIISY